MLLSNKMTVTIWLTLLQFYLIIWLSPSWILPSAAKAFPASVTKKLALIPSQPPSWLGMYVCTTDEMTVTFSSTIPVTPSLCKSIVVLYDVDTNAKVTNFFPFCTIGISMHQTSFFTLYIILYLFTLSRISFGALWTDRQNSSPLVPSPYPQVQLHWAGRNMGWMADWTRLDEEAHYLHVPHFIWASCMQHKSSCRI